MITHTLAEILAETIMIIGSIFMIGGGLLAAIFFMVWGFYKALRLLRMGGILIEFLLHRKEFKLWLSASSTDH